MFKLVTNRKFVRAVKRVIEELNAAGLKLNSEVRGPSIGLIMAAWAWSSYFDPLQDALQEIMNMTQGDPNKKGDS
jgi:hypothetical protein